MDSKPPRAHPVIEQRAPDPDFPAASFRLQRPLSAGTLVRLRAGGTLLLSSVRVAAVRAGGGEPLPFAHRYERAEMERRWRWYITTMTMAVVCLPRDLPEGTVLEVEAEYQERRMRGERATGRPSPQQSRDRYSGLSWWLQALAIADVDAEGGEPVAAPFEVRFVAGEAERLAAYLRHDGRLLAQHFDRAGNPAAASGDLVAAAGDGRRATAPVTGGAAATAVALPAQASVTEGAAATAAALPAPGSEVVVPAAAEPGPGAATGAGTGVGPDPAAVALPARASAGPAPAATGPDRDAAAGAGAWVPQQRRGGRIEVRDSAGRSALSNAPPLALDGTPTFFGEFHWHTDFSGDGQRPTADALRSARDELALDFAGPADHLSPSATYRGSGAAGNVTRTVAEQAAQCRPFEEPGRFCAVPAAELSRRYGHANIYAESWDLLQELTGRFAAELAPAWERQPDRYDLASLVRLCPPGRALVVPHHTNMDSFVREGVVREDGRPAWCAMHWPQPANRDVVRLVEMVQTRGCFEAEETDARWRIWDGGLGGSVRTALARGYRLGFVGGTDNHSGWPTRKGDGFCGLTAIQAPELAWGELFRALHARRCYATTGARIVADVTLNGAPMGSELRLQPGAERRLRVRIRGTAPLECVQVIHCGHLLAELPVVADCPDLDAEWLDERPGRPLEDVYYYIRARQHDGECLWTSPFWVDLPAE